MTYEEAIKEIEWIAERGFYADRGIVGTERIVEACNIAIKSLERQIFLEKQTPKKPKVCEGKYYCCPRCTNIIINKCLKYPPRLSYCLYCGQAIDWSEVE